MKTITHARLTLTLATLLALGGPTNAALAQDTAPATGDTAATADATATADDGTASIDASVEVSPATDTGTTATAPAPEVVETPEVIEPPPAEPAATDDFRNAWIAIGARIGVYVPGIVNRMDPHVVAGIDFTLLLPFIERRLGIVVELGYSPPGAGVALDDPRLGAMGGSWTASMTTDELFVSAGLVFRFLPPGEMFVPYIGFAGRVYFMQTIVSGTSGGQAFGTNSEVSTQGGVSATLGGEIRLGPGALVLECGFGWSDLPHTITGATSTSAISAQAGYRIFF